MAEQREHNEEQPGKKPRRQRRRAHGEGSVFELKGRERNRKKPWVAQITLENGRKKQTYHATQQEAIAARRKMLNELEQGILATGPHQHLADYLEYWLEDVHKPAIKLTSYLRYRVLLNKHLLPDLGHIQLTKLTVRHVQSFYAKKLEEGLSASTVRMLHAILHRALADAVRSTLVGRNVCDQVTLPRPRKPETRILSVEQAQHLVETVRGHRLEALFLVALTTGMRRAAGPALAGYQLRAQQHLHPPYRQLLCKARVSHLGTQDSREQAQARHPAIPDRRAHAPSSRSGEGACKRPRQLEGQRPGLLRRSRGIYPPGDARVDVS